MPRKPMGNAAIQAASSRRREAALERLRAVIRKVDNENQLLQTEVAEFQGALDELRSNIEDLCDSTEDFQSQISTVNVASLRQSARRLGDVADGWLKRESQGTGGAPGRKNRSAA